MNLDRSVRTLAWLVVAVVVVVTLVGSYFAIAEVIRNPDKYERPWRAPMTL